MQTVDRLRTDIYKYVNQGDWQLLSPLVCQKTETGDMTIII